MTSGVGMMTTVTDTIASRPEVIETCELLCEAPFPNNLRIVRQTMGFPTPAKLAKRLYNSPGGRAAFKSERAADSVIRRIERGEDVPSVDTLLLLASVINVEASQLLIVDVPTKVRRVWRDTVLRPGIDSTDRIERRTLAAMVRWNQVVLRLTPSGIQRDFSLSPSALHRLENGERSASTLPGEIRRQIARMLGVSSFEQYMAVARDLRDGGFLASADALTGTPPQRVARLIELISHIDDHFGSRIGQDLASAPASLIQHRREMTARLELDGATVRSGDISALPASAQSVVHALRKRREIDSVSQGVARDALVTGVDLVSVKGPRGGHKSVCYVAIRPAPAALHMLPLGFLHLEADGSFTAYPGNDHGPGDYAVVSMLIDQP